MKFYGQPKMIDTDQLPSYKSASRKLGMMHRQETGRWLNNRAENSHQPPRRSERVMGTFRRSNSLQQFAAIQSCVHNNFNLEHHFCRREEFKENRSAALAEWRQLAAGGR